MKHIASIPNNIYYRWMIEDGMDARTVMRMKGRETKEWLRRRLNDPDWRHLRTGLGAV